MPFILRLKVSEFLSGSELQEILDYKDHSNYHLHL